MTPTQVYAEIIHLAPGEKSRVFTRVVSPTMGCVVLRFNYTSWCIVDWDNSEAIGGERYSTGTHGSVWEIADRVSRWMSWLPAFKNQAVLDQLFEEQPGCLEAETPPP